MAKAVPKTAKTEPAKHHRRADQYNDPKHDYRKYWEGREYENAAEEVALHRLLANKHFRLAVDVGGGFGRLSVLLGKYADKVVLAEPSQQQLDMSKGFLKDHSNVEAKKMQASDLDFADESVDLLIMVRVMHHLPDPTYELNEIARVLSPAGEAIIEVANYAHARNRLKHLLQGKRIPLKPVDIRSAANRGKDEIPFVNHNPKTVIRQFELAGLEVERVLSVSNLRSPGLKKYLTPEAMLSIEKILQRPLAPVYFGPSIFFLVRKTS